MFERDTPEQVRLFIAVGVPEAIKDEMERAQAELRRGARDARIRWAGREQFHVTLRFLGNVEGQRLEALGEAVRGACVGFRALHLRAARVGFFPDGRNPRVVWVGVEDEEQQLASLQRAVESASQPFTAEAPEERGFSGHVTLGRIKGIRRPEVEELGRLAAGMAERVFGEWTGDEVEIIRSELSPAGARYTALAGARLPVRGAG